MAQEKQPSEGRKSDSGSRETKPETANLQGVDLGASKGADLQVSAAAPAAFASLSGYLKTGEEPIQKSIVDDAGSRDARAATPAQDVETSPIDTAGTQVNQDELTASAPDAPDLASDFEPVTAAAPVAKSTVQGSASKEPAVSSGVVDTASKSGTAPQTPQDTSQQQAASSDGGDEDIREPETDRSFSSQMVENSTDGSTVILLPEVGQYGDQISYSFTDADGNPVTPSGFQLVGNEVQIAPGGVLDFETAETQVIYVTATTPNGTSSPWPVTLTVSDTAEALVLEDGGATFTDIGVAEASITGGSGADTITGHAGGSVLDGAAGNDALTGNSGDDNLTGGAGDDRIDGGAGDDVAFFTGTWADYQITEADGVFTVTDLRPGSPDGTDTLINVETLSFADGSLPIAEALNDAPELTTADGNVTENAAGAVVGSVAATDADAGDTVALTIDDARFEVVDGQLKLRDDTSLDYEADGPTISVTITATDSQGATDTQVVTVTVDDTGEALVLDDGGITFTDTGVAETSITGGAGDDTITGHNAGAVLDGADGHDQLTGGASDDVLTGGHGDDTLDGGAGADVATFSGNWADYTITEADGVYTVTDNRLDSPDGTDTLTDIETLRFADGDRSAADAVNDAPELTAPDGSVIENAAGANVTTLQSSDADAGDKATLTVDDARFEIVNGQLKLRDDVSLDYETDGPSVAVTVTATDSHGATDTQVVTVTIDDTGEALVLDNGGTLFTDTGVAETSVTGGAGDDTITGHADGAIIDGASGDDAIRGNSGDDSLTGGTGDDRIDGGAGDDVAFFTGAWADYQITEADGVFTVTDLRPDSPDGTDTLTNVETLNFADGSLPIAEALNDAPELKVQSGTITENDAGAVVGTVAARDADAGDTITLSVDDTRFEIVDDQLKLRDGVSLDYEADGAEISVTLTATDSHGATDTEVVRVTITDTGEALVLGDDGTAFTDTGVAETSITGGAGNDTITAHADGGTLAGGVGHDALSGGAGEDALTGGMGDDVLDGGEGSDRAIFDGDLSDFSVRYDTDDKAFKISDVNAADGDEGTDLVVNVEAFEFNGVTYTQDQMITEAARQANTGPGNPSIASGGAVDENSGAGTVVATLIASDADGDALTYTITDADGNAVTDSNFEIVGNEIRVRDGADLDFETATAHGLFVTASDTFETSAPQEISITVNDVAEAIQLDDGGDTFTDTGVTETSITGGDGADTIEAGAGDDQIEGGAGDDAIYFGDGDDSVSGGAGNDVIRGDQNWQPVSGSSTLDGGAGNDTIYSSSDDSTLYGGEGNDYLRGEGGTDTAIYDGDIGDYQITYSTEWASFTITDTNSANGDEGFDVVSGVEIFVFNGVSYTEAEIHTEAARQANTGPGSPSVASGGAVDENSATGTVVATLTATDTDGDTLTYAITDAEGNPATDSNFEVVGNEVRVRDGANLDYEAATSHGLYVTASDAFETSTPQAITVAVNDVAENVVLDDSGVNLTDATVAETSITGGSGDDTIIAHDDGGDLAGGAGNDRLEGRSGDDILTGGAGDDHLRGWSGDDTLEGGDGADTLYGEDGNDSASGGAGNDALYGGTGSDTLSGGIGDDNLFGEDGDDVLSGGDGNDALGGGTGDDQIDGGDGTDLMYLGGSLSDVSVSYDSDTETFTIIDLNTADGDDGTDTATGIENFYFTGEGQTYTQAEMITEAARQANTGPGSPSIASGGAVDENSATGTVVATLTATDTDGDALTYTITDADGNAVTDSNFEIVGNEVRVRDGADLDFEAATSHGLFVTASDTFETSAPQAIIVTVNDVAETIQLADGGVTFADTGVTETSVTGGEQGDDITGTSGNDNLIGAAGFDSLTGGDGDDYLDGGTGYDTLDGGAGDDTLSGGFADDVLIGGDGADMLDGGDWSDTIQGDAGDDTLVGGAGWDVFTGGTGDDSIQGDNGVDTAVWDGDLADFSVSYDSGTSTFTITDNNAADGADEGTDTVTSVENFTFNGVTYTDADLRTEAERQANTGPGQAEVAMGGSVDENSASGTVVATLKATDVDGDRLTYTITDADGKPIADSNFEIVGDEIRVHGKADLDYETATSHSLYITASDAFETSKPQAITVTVNDVAENLVLDADGANFADTGVAETSITGGENDDKIIAHEAGSQIDGAGGHDYIEGGTGDDTLSGGAGDDTIYYGGGSNKVFGGDGDDIIDAKDGDLKTTGNDYIEAGAGNDVVSSGGSDDTILGEDGSDTLNGQAGDDTLVGGSGDDVIDGGDGSDRATYDGDLSDFSVLYDADAKSFKIRDLNAADGDEGTDLVVNVEAFEFNGATYTQDQMITEAARQANIGPGSPSVASGGAVDENSATGTVVATLTATDTDGDSLTYKITDADGNAVADSNFEIFGNEIRIRDGADLDFEAATSHGLYVTASDTFETSTPQAITVTVSDVAEAIVLADGGVSFTDTGVTETSVTGGTGADSITGSSGADSIDGGAGNDTLQGGNGDDTLQGGAGSDTVIYDGDLGDFSVSYDAGDETFTITDLNATNGDEGIDIVAGVESFAFNGTTYTAAELQTEAARQANTGPGSPSVASGVAVDENSATGTVVATLTATDTDGDALTYAITDVDGNAVADSNFEIVGNEIRVRDGADLDFETATSHGLYVTASDTFETSAPQAITVTVNDVAEAIQLADGGVTFTDTGVTETSITGGDGADTIEAGAGNDQIDGGAGDDAIYFGDGDDSVSGGAGNDVIRGTENWQSVTGNSTLDGGAGNDTIYSGNDDSSLHGGEGNDYLRGEGGTDTVVYDCDFGDYQISYSTEWESFTITDTNTADGDEGRDVVSGVETFVFNGVSYTEAEMHTEADRQANTGPGSPSVASGGAVDENSAAGTVAATLTATDTDGDALTYTITDADGNAVTDSNFEIVGNEVRVRDGADVDYESATSHGLYVTASDAFETSAPQAITVTVNDVTEAIQLADGGVTFTDTGVTETSVAGGTGADSITGSAGNDNIAGGAGDDTVRAGAGDDNFDDTELSNGNDDIDMGAGNDTAWGGDGDDTIVGGDGNDLLVGENGSDILTGDGGVDRLSGGAGADTLKGGTGNDTLEGDSGTDTAIYDGDFSDFQVVYDGDNDFTITDLNATGGDEGADTVTDVENFTFNGVSYTAAEMITEAARQANEAPTEVTFASGGSVNETVTDGGTIAAAYDPSGATVATLATTDANSGDRHTYTLVNDASGKFEIVGDEVRVKAGQVVDYETDTSFDLTIRTTDEFGETHDEVLTLNVTDFEGDYTAGDTGEAITGTSEEDTITGGAGVDTIDGGAGDDVIVGGGSPDLDALVLLNFDDGGAVASDTSGNDRDGAFVGDAVDGGTGWNGQGTGVLLDGDGDYVEIPNDAAFDLAAGTVSVRFNADSLLGEQTIFSRDSMDFDGGGHITTTLRSNGSVEVRLQSASEEIYMYSDAGSVTAGDWAHIAVSFGPDGATLFLNGAAVDTNAFTSGISGNSEPWTLGADQGASSDGVADNLRDFFTGSIDEFALFDSQLTATEIADIEASGIALGPDELSGGDGDDSITGGNSADLIYGGAGVDTLDGGAGNDTIDGGIGADRIDGGDGNDSILGADGVDTIYGGAGDDVVFGEEGNDSLYGDEGSDTLDGGNGDDLLQGGAGDDVFIGGAGNDRIYMGSGKDTVYGGDGDDSIGASVGSDLVFGGAGNDTISGGGYSYESDTLYGGEGDDVLDGNAGNDILYGEAGNDTLTISSGADSLDGGDDADTFQVASTTGAFGDDTIIGGEGGDDDDTLDLSGMTGPVTVNYTGSESGTVTDGSNTITFSEIENIILTDGADRLDATGDTLGTNVDTGAGDDTIIGGDGGDSIEGGAGNDVLSGGTGGAAPSGFDFYNVTKAYVAGDNYSITGTGHFGTSDASDINISEAPTTIRITDNDGQLDGDNLTNERTDDTDQTVELDGVEYSFNVDFSQDYTDGTNTYTFAILDVDLDHDGEMYHDDDFGNGHILIQIGGPEIPAGADLSLVPDTIGQISSLDYSAIGGIRSYDDTIDGGSGNDTIDGGAGADSLMGGAGDDHIYTGVGADWVDGGEGSDTIYLEGLSGGVANTLTDSGTTGTDRVVLLEGDNTYEIQSEFSAASGIEEIDGSDLSWGLIKSYAATDWDFTDVTVTNVQLHGSQYDDKIRGTAGDDTIVGNAGNDTIDGGTGADLITGGDGDDVIAGGIGNDTIDGGSSNTGWITFQNGDDLHGTSGQDFYSWAPEAGDDAVIRFNDTPADSGNSDGVVDYVEVETINSSWLTIGDFDLGTDQIVLQETWASASITSFSDGSDIVLTYANGNQQGFSLYHSEGTAILSDIFTTISPEISAGDFVVYEGDFADFDVSYNAATGAFTITDGNLSDGLDEGTDTVSDIETFSFNGINFDASEFMGGSDVAAGSHDYDQGTNADYGSLTVDGGNGEATINTEDTSQVIYGRAANDTITSSSGDDVVFAGSGDDMVSTGSGSDTIFGGTGSDWMSGGDGNDTFVVTALEGSDTIDGGSGWTDAIELAGFSGEVSVSGNTVDGEGWTMVLEGGHSVTGQTLDSLELTADSVGVITFDDGGVIDFSGIERITF